MTNKQKELEVILAWEERLKTSQYAIDMLEAQASKMDKTSGEYEEYMDLVNSARVSFSAAYSGLVIKKAMLGIVGGEFYVPK